MNPPAAIKMATMITPDTAPAAGPAFANPTGSVPVVEVLSAEKIYPNGTRALDPVTLTVEQGEFVTLLGPSGCGKSTLLKMIANLIGPSEGRLRWWHSGFEAVGSPGRKLVFVFQDPTLMPWARVRANVRLPLDLAGMPRADGRVNEALDLVGHGVRPSRQGAQGNKGGQDSERGSEGVHKGGWVSLEKGCLTLWRGATPWVDFQRIPDASQKAPDLKPRRDARLPSVSESHRGLGRLEQNEEAEEPTCRVF